MRTVAEVLDKLRDLEFKQTALNGTEKSMSAEHQQVIGKLSAIRWVLGEDGA